ncbi:MAG TPA: hypothetical protein IAB04_05610, partial [Candidatus Avimonoglobus intestinipullorum]|nr:hypothetical protein [Candidatus Avimonoglobus intestinipullorum]
MKQEGYIYGINGPVVHAKGNAEFQMHETVLVGEKHLIGEIIGIDSDAAIVQVYEETTGLKPGEPVASLGKPFSVTLAPGILSNIFDGIERPLREIKNISGAFIDRGIDISSLDEEKKWETQIQVKPGDAVEGGTVIATVQETSLILHKVMVPPEMRGTVVWTAADGAYTINEPLVRLETPQGEKTLTMKQEWPIRTQRPYRERRGLDRPLITGQRIVDTMFPIAKGGAAAIPGGFGTGKTMTQHQLAKWSDADIIVYIGCGERGNEMTQVLEEFSELLDPKSGKPLLDRTVLIANTSNM